MKKLQFLIVASVMILMSACTKDLDKQPLSAVTSGNFWQTESDAEKAVNNAYRYLSDVDNQAFISCATDDSYSWSNWPSDIQYAGNGSATSTTGAFNSYWQHYYQAIAAANDVLDNIDKVSTLQEELKDRYKAEVRFIRAYAYQQLTGMFGDVPLITHIPSVQEFNAPRTPKADIVQFIVKELDEVANVLPLSYSSADKGRITKGAALALKARVLLYNEKWEDAAAAAKAVMDLNTYSIDKDYLSIFNGTNKNSPEIIVAAQHIKNTKPHAWATWICGPTLGGWSQVVPLQGLVDAYECTDGKTIAQSPLYDPSRPFENRDPRLKLTIAVPGSSINGKIINVAQSGSIDALGKNNASFSGYYYKKYVPADIDGDWSNNSYNDIILIRYAEVLLTYAEAKIEAGQIDQSVYEAINKVRERPGINMPPVTAASASSVGELREIVRRERHVEFPVEDNRFFDIRRWKIAETVMNGPAYGILNYFDSTRGDYGKHVLVEQRSFNPSRDYLWPIPQNEISLNTNLGANNPGW